jgi:hypothetical protein
MQRAHGLAHAAAWEHACKASAHGASDTVRTLLAPRRSSHCSSVDGASCCLQVTAAAMMRAASGAAAACGAVPPPLRAASACATARPLMPRRALGTAGALGGLLPVLAGRLLSEAWLGWPEWPGPANAAACIGAPPPPSAPFAAGNGRKLKVPSSALASEARGCACALAAAVQQSGNGYMSATVHARRGQRAGAGVQRPSAERSRVQGLAAERGVLSVDAQRRRAVANNRRGSHSARAGAQGRNAGRCRRV